MSRCEDYPCCGHEDGGCPQSEDHYHTERRVRRGMRTADRFSNYREITARFNSTGTCGHQIKAGDRIGWNRNHGTRCAACWERWCGENAAAEADERMLAGQTW